MAGYLRWRAGAWRLRVDDGTDPLTGRRRQIHRTHPGPNTKAGRKQAEVALAKLVTDVQSGHTQDAAPGADITVAELIERYIRHASLAKEWSPGAADETRRRVAMHITPRIGDVLVRRLRAVDIDHLYGQLRVTGLGQSTVARLHDILRAALRQAVRWEIILSSPVDRMDPVERGSSTVIPPTIAELSRLFDAAAQDFTLTLYVRLSAVTGARRGQMVALRWSAVDLDAGEIRFTTSLAKVPGGTVEKGTKTGARYPVAIDPKTVALLREHRRRQAEASLAVGQPLVDDAFLFAVDPAGSKAWHPDGASQRFARLRKRAGLEKVKLHDLRHWMSTQVLTEGFDPVTMAGRGGWSDPTTPLRLYAHFQPARDRAAADRLGEVLDGG